MPAPLLAGPLTRVANETLRLPDELPAGSFEIEEAFPGLRFNRPVGLVTPPGETNRLFVLEQVGLISVIPDLENPRKETFLDLTDVTVSSGESGLLGLAFHPQYEDNGWFYVFYSTRISNELVQRVSRFERHGLTPNRAVPSSEQILIDQVDQANNHNGGDLHFGPDGYLYISFGDEGGANDRYNNSRFIDRDFFAAIARIDVDQRPGSLSPNPHEGVHPGTYTIPPDNPFIGVTTFMGEPVESDRVRTEFWAVGLRNPWRMAFDRARGELLVGDVGQGSREEINIIEKGRHYGWSFREGTRTFRIGPDRADEPDPWVPMEPVWDYGRSDGISVTGGVVYRGLDHPELYEAYVFGDYGSGEIWAMHQDDGGEVRVESIASEEGNEISAFGVDPRNGEVLYTAHRSGQIKRIARRSRGFTILIPKQLSRTGAFADLETLTPEAGIVEYEPNASFWSNGAMKRRWFSVPDLADTIEFHPEEPWRFPVGTTWIKHFEMELEPGNPASRHRVETRFLVKTETGSYGLSYAWNEDQTDAQLMENEGERRDLAFQTPEGPVTRPWTFPSRNACRACHTKEGGHALSFHTAQLNRDHPYGDDSYHQLRALSEAGYFSEPLTGSPEVLPRLVSPQDDSQPLEARARAYLAVNCAQCHQEGGTALGSWDARARLSLEATGLVDGRLAGHHGEDEAARLIVPGDPERSVLLARMQGEDGLTRMPLFGGNVVDESGVALLRDWVESLESMAVDPAYEAWIASFAEALEGRNTAPWADADHDGLINEQEFRAGTDPSRGDQRWHAAVVVGEDDHPSLVFPSLTNGSLVIQRSENARDWQAWEPDPTAVATQGDGSVRVPLDPGEVREFFRFRFEALEE